MPLGRMLLRSDEVVGQSPAPVLQLLYPQGGGHGELGFAPPEEPAETKARAGQELYQTAAEFLKLEKAELGGVRGSILGSQVFQIYEEVAELLKGFADCKYDPLDPAEEVSERCCGSLTHLLINKDHRWDTLADLA